MTARRSTSLRTRLIGFCTVLAAASIGTTAWLTVTGTSSAVRDDYMQNLRSISDVYARLSGYAATHPSWANVAPFAHALARQDGTRIRLTTRDGQLLFDSRPGSRPTTGTSARPAALINPLQPDSFLARVALSGGIDRRAVGPFALSPAQRAAIRSEVDAARACYARATGLPAPAPVVFPNGRQYLSPGVLVGQPCRLDDSATPGEAAAGRALVRVVAPCLPSAGLLTGGGLIIKVVDGSDTSGIAGQGFRVYRLVPASAGFQGQLADLVDAVNGSALACVTDARRTFLAPYVTPPADLYLSAAAELSAPDLSPAGRLRVVGAGLLILAVTVLLCYVGATRLRRPLAGLTEAVTLAARGSRASAVPLAGTSEMRELAAAVNDLAVQLDQADRQRQDMISDIAHELRTPLSNIRGWLEAVHDEVVQPDTSVIERLLREALLLQDVVNDLHDLALADARRLAIHPEPVDVRILVEQVVAAATVGAPRQVVPVTVDAAGDTVLRADPTRLRQIVANLLTNALRATTRGAVNIRVTGEPSRVVIEVADTGEGIAADDLPHLFDRFWRADKSRSRERGGSGLGLAITQSLVLAHGGSIDATSRPGFGTAVTVRLPRATGR